MIQKRLRALLILLVAAGALAGVMQSDQACAAAPAEVASVAEAGMTTAPAPLKRWTIGLTAATVRLDEVTEIDPDHNPTGEIDEKGKGGGLSFGYLFGDRFLLAVQGLVMEHPTDSTSTQVFDMEFLLTGTVLFRPRAAFQPFLRGGIGVAGLIQRSSDDDLSVLGPSAIAGGGIQLRLARWLSLEFEVVGTFANYLRASRNLNDPGDEDSWRVRTSSAGTRTGLSLYFWF